MTYLLATYWLPLLLALIVGGATGYLTFQRPGAGWWPRSWPGWLKLLGIAFVAGVVVALFKWLPNGPGLWLETALLLLAAWFIGVLLGSWLASLSAGVPVAEPKPAPIAAPVAAPVAAAAVAVPEPEAPAVEGDHPGARPKGLAAAAGKADDLKIISGIGPKNERLLNGLGIYHFHQIAAWDAGNVEWVNSYLRFKGRIEREDWVAQAKVLAKQ